MPRTDDAAGESDSSNATLCGNCSKALQKPLVCKRVFITNVKGTFFGMSESEEASKRR